MKTTYVVKRAALLYAGAVIEKTIKTCICFREEIAILEQKLTIGSMSYSIKDTYNATAHEYVIIDAYGINAKDILTKFLTDYEIDHGAFDSYE